MKNLAPIVLFVYNRPQHTLQTLEALAGNSLASESILYIYADGPKDGAKSKTIEQIEETRRLIRLRQWCKEVHIFEAEKNKGLADSIIEGVTYIVNKHGRIIVLEDDIVTSPGFLSYMNNALNVYRDESRVMHISGYSPTTGQGKLPETYLLRFMSCWGWATWADRWKSLITDIDYLHDTIYNLPDFKELLFEGDKNPCLIEQIEANYKGEIKTWAIKWYLSIFLQKGLCLFPRQSLVRNIGFDGTGENCDINTVYDVKLAQNIRVEKIHKIEESKIGNKYLRRFYKYGENPSRKVVFSINYPKAYLFLHDIYKKIKK